VTPLNDVAIKRHMRDVVLEALLNDTHRAWQLQTDGSYARVLPDEGVEPLNSQQFLLDWYSRHTLLED
jgi:polyphosphate kinase